MVNINIIKELLRLLDVKYTTKYLIESHKSNPYRNSLYGLSVLLSSYSIKNVALQLENKQDLQNLETPFVAYASNDFVLVKRINNGKVNCLFNNENLNITIDEFVSIWSGVLLMVETDKKTIEPNYIKNKRKEILEKLLLYLIYAISFLLVVLCFIFFKVWAVKSIVILSVLFVGIYICFLLLQKQLKVQSTYADKLCSFFNKKGCNSVLESESAKLGGIFSWSEIGFAYFVSTFFICMGGESCISYCAWFNLCALPYTLWSVWYQRFRVNQWCPMCLIVMGIFWILFVIHLYCGYFKLQTFDWINCFLLTMLYLLSFLTTHQIVSIFAAALSRQELIYEINNLKMNENVFMELLKSNTFYKVSSSVSHIIFGNKNARTRISILTNPHCEPCSKMHFRLNNLLNNASDKYCVQYIFSSFNDLLSISNKILIAIYLKYGADKSGELYDEWFKTGKYEKDIFIKQYNLDINEMVEIEYSNHETWINETQLRTTPTILINGYELPTQYKIEDLKLLDF